MTGQYRDHVLRRLPEQVLVATAETDLSKPWAKRLERTGQVTDHSDARGTVRRHADQSLSRSDHVTDKSEQPVWLSGLAQPHL